MSQQRAAAYLRHGQTPFFRLPTADFDGAGASAYAGADAVLLGVPWDGSVTYRPGARFAPYELRRVSALVQSYHPGHQLDVFRALRVLDGGNVAFPPFHADSVRELIQAAVDEVLSAGAVPFVVGGDHAIALPVLRALARRHGPVAVVHVDAHLDTSTSEVWGEPFHHGTPFRNAVEEGLIARDALHQIGIRATWGHPEEGAFAARAGATRYDMDRIDREGTPAIAAAIAAVVGDAPVYLSFDIDGIDPAFAPGTGTPVPGGLTAREAIQLLRGLAGIRLVGMDLVEVCPALDHADITLHLGAHLLFEGLALAAIHRQASRSGGRQPT
ncbi:agmatinase [Sorangium cellulosum]|uniref:Agmatinase n=1 Tax=Sorangium cellulosum TaxID=56 RepID=A0A4P2PSV4_SORCE|nr:agmatinase [Sorangium cellulosum]AUX19598.1 agmatinase [Sorangium cellulosum]